MELVLLVIFLFVTVAAILTKDGMLLFWFFVGLVFGTFNAYLQSGYGVKDSIGGAFVYYPKKIYKWLTRTK